MEQRISEDEKKPLPYPTLTLMKICEIGVAYSHGSF